jgi:hypothetical protein
MRGAGILAVDRHLIRGFLKMLKNHTWDHLLQLCALALAGEMPVPVGFEDAMVCGSQFLVIVVVRSGLGTV